jgi:hypothetical protein
MEPSHSVVEKSKSLRDAPDAHNGRSDSHTPTSAIIKKPTLGTDLSDLSDDDTDISDGEKNVDESSSSSSSRLNDGVKEEGVLLANYDDVQFIREFVAAPTILVSPSMFCWIGIIRPIGTIATKLAHGLRVYATSLSGWISRRTRASTDDETTEQEVTGTRALRDLSLEVRASKLHGNGLFATRKLVKGELLPFDLASLMNDGMDMESSKFNTEQQVREWLAHYNNMERIRTTTACRGITIKPDSVVLRKFVPPVAAFQLIRDVAEGEEITRFYGHHYWLTTLIDRSPFYSMCLAMEAAFGGNGLNAPKTRARLLEPLPLIAVALSLQDEDSKALFADLEQTIQSLTTRTNCRRASLEDVPASQTRSSSS